MRRVLLLLLFLVPFTTFASAQTRQVNPPQALFFAAPGAPVATPDPEIVVARLMTFDRDNDGLVVKSELPERMQNLIAADASGDGALDRAEIRKLASPVNVVPVAATVATFAGGRVGGGGGYMFGDAVSLSTRSHVEGALDDLKLADATRSQALEIIRPFMDRLEADASAVLFKELDGLLTPQQMDTFKLSIERQLSQRVVREVPVPPPFNKARVDGARAFFVNRGPDPQQLLDVFTQRGENQKAATAALDGFKARLRPGEVDRQALLDELHGVLNSEELENFGAALQRRPLVKASGVVAGVAGGVVELQKMLRAGEGPAVLRLTMPPQQQER